MFKPKYRIIKTEVLKREAIFTLRELEVWAMCLKRKSKQLNPQIPSGKSARRRLRVPRRFRPGVELN